MASNFTYAILTGGDTTVGSIKYWAQHAEIPVEQILEEAQLYIFQTLRVAQMKATTPVSIATGTSTLALPDDFLDPIGLLLDGDADELDYVQENLLNQQKDDDGNLETGRPTRFTIINDEITFELESDDNLAGTLMYYARPNLIASGAGNETNILSTRYPTVLRRACLALAYEHRKRDNFQAEYVLAENAIEKANNAADMQRRGQIMR